METTFQTRTGLAADEIRQAFLQNLLCALGRPRMVATPHDLHFALALTLRDRGLQPRGDQFGIDRWQKSTPRGLPLDRIFTQVSSREQLAQPKHHRSHKRGTGKMAPDVDPQHRPLRKIFLRSIRDYCERIWNIKTKHP